MVGFRDGNINDNIEGVDIVRLAIGVCESKDDDSKDDGMVEGSREGNNDDDKEVVDIVKLVIGSRDGN
eukprot:3146740-Ditylum_brightwellii.AAC.1